MKAFRFQLEAVLTLREQAEQAAQQQCARALATLESAKLRVQVAETRMAAHEELYRQQMASGTRADWLEQWRGYALSLRERRAQVGRELALAQEQFDAASRRLVLATQRREALERLREHKRRLHQYHVAQLEQKLLDDSVGRTPALMAPLI